MTLDTLGYSQKNDFYSTDINIKDSRKTRQKKLSKKNEIHKKNPKSLEYYANNKNIPLLESNTMNTVVNPTASKKASYPKKTHSAITNKAKNQLHLMFTNLVKTYKREGVFFNESDNFEQIEVLRDYNVHVDIGNVNTPLSVRSVIGEFNSFKELVIQNPGNFSLLKTVFSKWLFDIQKKYDARTEVQNAIDIVLDKHNESEHLRKFLPSLTIKLINSLKKATKQPYGFQERINQINQLWLDESNEIFHIEQIEDQLNFKSYEQSFPLARSMKRKFSIYIGKTNSGKTYAALNDLAAGINGVYLAPLRLMAQEGQESLTERGIVTNLITGEEQQLIEGASHISSTVEMCNMSRMVDVAVIDEIQTISDASRGWAWSQALVGVPAKRVILVGSEEALPFIIPIIENLNEEYEIKRFERKTPLNIRAPLWRLKDLKQGDCVVVFSRKTALEMKNAIEATGKKCSVIYGNLSPDVRRAEANKFKSGENPILVATDAIGMGLNLPISRLFFSTLEKFDGIETRYLNVSEIKQIAGRAGRFGLAETGEVGIMFNDSHEDSTLLHKAIYGQYDKVYDTRVPVGPNLQQIQTICETLGKKDLYSALIFFKEKLIKNNPLYKAANLESIIEIASMIKNKKLDLSMGLNYSCVPIDTNSDVHTQHFFKWLNNHLTEKVNLAPDLPDVVMLEKNDSYSLYEAENYVKLVMAYRWLHYKYPKAYPDIDIVTERAKQTNTYIEMSLHKHIVISKNPKWKR